MLRAGQTDCEVGWQGSDAAVGTGAQIQACQACPFSLSTFKRLTTSRPHLKWSDTVVMGTLKTSNSTVENNFSLISGTCFSSLTYTYIQFPRDVNESCF